MPTENSQRKHGTTRGSEELRERACFSQWKDLWRACLFVART